MASPRRLEQVAVLLKEELAKIIEREIDIPSGTLLTVTRVVLSPDMRYGNAFLSVLGPEPEELLSALTGNIYHVQQLLNRAVRMRPVPQMRFMLDHEEARRERIESSLAKIRHEEETAM